MTAYHLIAFAKVVLFTFTQFSLLAFTTNLEEDNDGPALVWLAIYGGLLFLFFYSVYPI